MSLPAPNGYIIIHMYVRTQITHKTTTYIYIYIHTYTYTNTCTHIYVYATYTHAHTYTRTHTHAHVHTHTHTYTRTRTHAHTHTHTHTRTHTYTHAHTHTHTNTHTHTHKHTNTYTHTHTHHLDLVMQQWVVKHLFLSINRKLHVYSHLLYDKITKLCAHQNVIWSHGEVSLTKVTIHFIFSSSFFVFIIIIKQFTVL